MGSFDVQQFLSFIQADGYEPLTVEAVVYMYTDPESAAEAAGKVTSDPKSTEGKAGNLYLFLFVPRQLTFSFAYFAVLQS